MSRPTISQNEARRLKKRVEYLEGILRGERVRWGSQFPGTHIATITTVDGDPAPVAVKTARLLQHAAVVVSEGKELRFYACGHREVKP